MVEASRCSAPDVLGKKHPARMIWTQANRRQHPQYLVILNGAQRNEESILNAFSLF